MFWIIVIIVVILFAIDGDDSNTNTAGITIFHFLGCVFQIALAIAGIAFILSLLG